MGEGNSLERLQEYMTIEQEQELEAPAHGSGVPPAAWPMSGTLCVRNLTARYAPDGPAVLHALSFDVDAGERIGVVGRTGSGKSSLVLALLRCMDVQGDVWFDGVRTGDVRVRRVRQEIGVIPQVVSGWFFLSFWSGTIGLITW